VRYALRWWETLGRAERIVAMSLATGGVVAIVNSTVWAVAVAYMEHEKARARVAIAGYGAGAAAGAGDSAVSALDDDEQRLTGASHVGLPPLRR